MSLKKSPPFSAFNLLVTALQNAGLDDGTNEDGSLGVPRTSLEVPLDVLPTFY